MLNEDDGDREEGPLVLGAFLPYRFSVVQETISALFARSYEERFGLSIPEWRVMAVVGEVAERSTQEVIELTAMDRVKVSRAVIRLADKGLLDRKARPGDQRAQVLRLSRKGRGVYREIVPLARGLQAALAASLTAGEQRQLEVILDKLGACAKGLLAAERQAAAPALAPEEA